MVQIDNTVLERVRNSVEAGAAQPASYWRGAFATAMQRDTTADDDTIYRVIGTLQDLMQGDPSDDDVVQAIANAEDGTDIGFNEYVETVPIDEEIRRNSNAIMFGDAIAKSTVVNSIISEQMDYAVKGRHNPVVVMLALQRLHRDGAIDLDAAPRLGTTFDGDNAKSSVNKKISNNPERYKEGDRTGNWFEDVTTRLPTAAAVFANIRAISLAGAVASKKGATLEISSDIKPLFDKYVAMSAVRRNSEAGTWRSRKNAAINALKSSIELHHKMQEINEMKKLSCSILRDEYDENNLPYDDTTPLEDRRLRKTTTPVFIYQNVAKCQKLQIQASDADCLSVAQVVRCRPAKADAAGGSIADLRKSTATNVTVTAPTTGLPNIKIADAKTMLSAVYSVWSDLDELKGKAKGKLLAYAKTNMFSSADANVFVKLRDLLDETISEGGLQAKSDAFEAEQSRSANQLTPAQQAAVTAKTATDKLATIERERIKQNALRREAEYAAEQALLDANKSKPKALGGRRKSA